MHRIRRATPGTLLALVLGALLAWPVSAADEPARLIVAPLETDAFPDLKTTVAVLDSAGIPVPGLPKGSFELIEDGRSVAVSSVQEVANRSASISVVLGLDVSGSMAGQPTVDAVAAINGFVDQVGPDDQVGGVSFGGPNCAVDRGPGLTKDKQALKSFMSSAAPFGDTPFYDAAKYAIEVALGAPKGKRMVVLLTDGEDTCSRANSDTVIEAAVRHEVPLYIIGLGPNLRASDLQHFAILSGGQYIAAGDSSDLAAIYQSLLKRLRTQYELTYRSAQLADRKEHLLAVRVRSEAGEASNDIRFTPPEVKLEPMLSLSDGQRIEEPVRVVARSSSPLVELTQADFYLDGQLLQSVPRPPLEIILDPANRSPGVHTVRVHAVDTINRGAETSIQVEFLGGFLPVWWPLALALLAPVLIVVSISLLGSRRAMRCVSCNYRLDPRWPACPNCRQPVAAGVGG